MLGAARPRADKTTPFPQARQRLFFSEMFDPNERSKRHLTPPLSTVNSSPWDVACCDIWFETRVLRWDTHITLGARRYERCNISDFLLLGCVRDVGGVGFSLYCGWRDIPSDLSIRASGPCRVIRRRAPSCGGRHIVPLAVSPNLSQCLRSQRQALVRRSHQQHVCRNMLYRFYPGRWLSWHGRHTLSFRLRRRQTGGSVSR